MLRQLRRYFTRSILRSLRLIVYSSDYYFVLQDWEGMELTMLKKTLLNFIVRMFSSQSKAVKINVSLNSTHIISISTMVTMMGMLRGGGVSNCLSSPSRLLLKQPSNGQLAPLPQYQGQRHHHHHCVQHHHHHVIIITINIVIA